MRKMAIAYMILIFLLMPSFVHAQESKEQLIESALINRYYPLLYEASKSQFDCVSVIEIKRLGTDTEFMPRFEAKVQLITYQGAHNPPNDLVMVTIQDQLTELKILKVERKQNLSTEEVRKYCESESKKRQQHLNR